MIIHPSLPFFCNLNKTNRDVIYKYQANQGFYRSFWKGTAGKALQSRAQDLHSSTQTWWPRRGTDVSTCPSLWPHSRWSSCVCPRTLSHPRRWPGLEGTRSGRSPQNWCSGRSYKFPPSDTHQCLMKRHMRHTWHIRLCSWAEADVWTGWSVSTSKLVRIPPEMTLNNNH